MQGGRDEDHTRMWEPREATMTSVDKEEGKLSREVSITSILNALHQPC